LASVRLEIYVEKGCPACRRSLSLAAAVRDRFPQVRLRVVDMSSGGGEYRRLVTATPTFVLNGDTFSLGNPSRAELESAIVDLLERPDEHEPEI
jgi:hypothetical protein